MSAADSAPARSSDSPVKLYVGRLSSTASKKDLEDLFSKYGEIVSLELKHGGFAFVEYKDTRDAEDAIAALNNFSFEGERITVEWSRRSSAGNSSCFICGGAGHWARECPDNREQGLDVRSGKCFKCGQPGHLARFCKGDRARSRSPGDRYDRYERRRSPADRYRDRYDDYRRRSPDRRRYEDFPRRDTYDRYDDRHDRFDERDRERGSGYDAPRYERGSRYEEYPRGAERGSSSRDEYYRSAPPATSTDPYGRGPRDDYGPPDAGYSGAAGADVPPVDRAEHNGASSSLDSIL